MKLAICFAHGADKYGNQGMLVSQACFWSLFGKAEIRSATSVRTRRDLQTARGLRSGARSWNFHIWETAAAHEFFTWARDSVRWQKMNSRSSPVALACENVRCALAQFIHICECALWRSAARLRTRHSLRALVAPRALWHALVPPNLREKYENFVLSCFAAAQMMNSLRNSLVCLKITGRGRFHTQEIDTKSHYHTRSAFNLNMAF
jgi:hypothetical protein